MDGHVFWPSFQLYVYSTSFVGNCRSLRPARYYACLLSFEIAIVHGIYMYCTCMCMLQQLLKKDHLGSERMALPPSHAADLTFAGRVLNEQRALVNEKRGWFTDENASLSH